MNTLKTLLLLSLTTVMACEMPTKNVDEKLPIAESSEKETEKVTNYYEDGKVKNEVTLKNGEKEGEALSYYPNGNLKYKITYKAGKKNGPATWYFQDGSLYQKRNHKDDEIDGLREDFTPSGKKITHSFYKEGHVLPGGQETKLDGTPRPNPTITVSEENDLKAHGVYRFKFDLSEDVSGVRYYVSMEDKSKEYWNEQQITTKGKTGIVEIPLKPGQMMDRKVTIYAHFTRTNGYEGVIDKTVSIRARN